MGKHTSLFGTIRHGLAVWKLYSKVVEIFHEKGGNKMLEYLISRFSEPSTWRGIIALATSLGVAISPDQIAAIIAIGMALMGVIGAFTKDKK